MHQSSDVWGRKLFKNRCRPEVTKGSARGAARIFAAMREIAHIPHPLMRITVHSYNGQYRIRFELDRYEQSFKYPESEHTLEELEALGSAMAEGVLLRFVEMRTQYFEHLSST